MTSEHFFVRVDNFPVNRGHVEIVSQRHTPDLFSLTADEWRELQQILASTKEYLKREYSPDGYNLGINDGQAAGQTIMHLHLHVIPRYHGDVPNPRGGIRNFKPALVKY